MGDPFVEFLNQRERHYAQKAIGPKGRYSIATGALA
jgi:hypothetical protein